ncbi:MAG TPA: ABC transporter permease [Actinomycetes bacterium]|nr:ABC transporter permease [Actinomycetes bacterium]
MSQPAVEEQLEPALADSVAAARARSSWELFRARFVKDKAAVVGVVMIVLLVLCGLTAPLFARITGHGPNELFQNEMLDPTFGLPKGPNAQFWFGADSVGRDLFVRVMYGARTSLTVAIVATGLATLVGVVLGMVAGFRGGAVDTIVSRAADIVLSLPILLFAIGIATVCSITAEGCLGGLLSPGLSLVIGIIAIFTWPNVARLVRGQVLSLREREFIEAARSLGARNWRIMFRELLPNLVAPIVVYATLMVPSNIIFEAALSFLGVGVPQTTPSWGRMLAEASSGQIFTVAWWMMLFPGLFLLATTLSFNMVGDGLRDALGPSERS